MDQTQRLDWEDDKEETPVEKHRPAGNLHMFAGAHGPAQDFPIYPGPNIIGRHSSCDITLPAQSVSKKHAILQVTGDTHTICDNGSLNKTRRSKVALEPEVRYALSNGDFLLFADVACRYSIVKKVEVQRITAVESITAEESDDDSMLVPGTQAALAIEKTPGAAIRRMGRGAVLARDSGDEDEEVPRGWNDGGEGGSKDALKTSGPTSKASFSPAADTVVPESDEENDAATSRTHFPSLQLRCDSETDNETPNRGSSFIPSSLNTLTSPSEKEPEKEEINRFLQINKEEKLVGELTETSSAGKDDASDGELLEKGKEERPDEADDRLTFGGGRVVSSDTLDSGLKDGGTVTDRRNGHENVNNLKNDEANTEVSSSSSLCLKDNKDETSERTIAATTATESNPESHIQAEEENLKPTEKDLKLEANLCLDSDTDVDEEVPTASATDVKEKDELETKCDKDSEQSKVGTSDASVYMDRNTNIDEGKEETSDIQHGRVSDINDSGTDEEDDTEVSKTGNDGSRTGNGNSSEVPKVDTISGANASTAFGIDSDTDVEDADITRSDDKKVDQKSRKLMEEKKEKFHLDSDTDVEDDGPTSSTKVRSSDSDSRAADETKDGVQLDRDTDVEDDDNVSSTDVPKGKHALNMDVEEGFHMDSDSDLEDVDVSSTVVTKEKQDSSNSVQDAREGLASDNDTDVDEEDQRPGPSSAAVQSKATTGSLTGDQEVEAVNNEKDTAGMVNNEAADLRFDSDTDVDEDDGTSAGPGPKKAEGSVKTIAAKNEAEAVNEATDLHMDSDTDVDEDDGTSAGPGPKKAQEPVNTIAEKNEAEAVKEAAALHMDSDTDVDEDDSSVVLDKSRTAEGELRSDAVSEGGDGNLDKVSGSSVSEIGGAAEVPGADTSTVSVESGEQETQNIDSRGADYELMATQCYLEPQEPESDLPDEEEATQAYILSSTWAEPDPFKRPLDPVGVLQISAVTLDKSEEEEEEEDENAIAETQLFCLEADQSPGPSIKETPQLEEEVVDNQQKIQPVLEGSGKEAQEPPPGAISQEDTEPVSQDSSTKPPVETGTWLHLRRDVPTSVWIKGLQQEGETSNLEDTTLDYSTQDELDLSALELEPTQSFILEPPDVQEHPIEDHAPSLLAPQQDHTKHGESAVPSSENPSRDQINTEQGVLAVSATEPSIPKMGVLAMPPTESPPTGPTIPEKDVSEVPSTKSAPTGSSVPETAVSVVSANESPPTESGVSAEPATKSPPKELSNMETQVTDDDATQVCSLTLPGYDVNVPQGNLEVPSNEDATQPCTSNVEDTASKEVQSTGDTTLAIEEEKAKLTETGKGKPSSKRGLSRSRKKDQPEKSTEIPTEKAELPEQAAPATHSAPEETGELVAGESGQSGPSIVVSEAKEVIEPEKGGRRRGRRKATEEPESTTKRKDELVVPTVPQKRTTRMTSETEPSTSGINEVKRKQPSRKSAVKMKEEKQDEAKEDFGSTSEKCKDNDVSEDLSEENPKKVEGLSSKDENVAGPTSMEMSVGQIDGDQEKSITSTSVEPSKNVSTSSKNSESEESRILDLPELPETISPPQNKRPVRGKKRAATKAKQNNTQETESNDVEDESKSETTGTDFEKQEDFKISTPRTSDSQDGGEEGPSGRRTRRSQVSTAETLKQEKRKVADTKASQIEKANKPCPDEQNSGNKRSVRQRRNVKEEVKEDSQTEEQTGRLPSKRAISLRGDPKNKEKNSQQTAIENPDSSPLPKRARQYSKEETPKSEQEVKEVAKTEEDNTVRPPRRTRKSYKEEQKTEDNEGSPESSVTAEAQTRRRTRRSSKEQDIPDKEETVKETVTSKRRNSKAEDTQLGEDQSKRSVRTRRVSKEEVAEETTRAINQEDTAGQNTSRRTRRTVKADEKTATEHVGDLKPDKELSQPERLSSRTRRKASADSEKLLETTEAKVEPSEGTKKRDDELSTQEETPKKGRTRRTLVKEEPSPVSTPVASRKRGQASKEDVELKRKKSDETQEAVVERPAGRRGRPRKLSTTDDSQTSAASREISTPEPSPSRSSRQRQGPLLNTPTDVRTPRRTGRLSSSALTTSPYIPQSGAPPKVLFTGVVDAMGEEIIRSLGGDIADSVFDCTHLVTDRVRRTVKFLCALARGIPIVTLDWIDKCKKSGCFLSHTKFLVKDKEQEKSFNFVLSESLQKAKRRLLFEGYEIHVTPSVKPDPELMKDIICCSGATFLPKMPRTFKEKCVIVSCPEDATRCKSVPSRTPITTAEFLLSGILRQEVNPGAYLLSSVAEDSAPAPSKRRR